MRPVFLAIGLFTASALNGQNSCPATAPGGTFFVNVDCMVTICIAGSSAGFTLVPGPPPCPPSMGVQPPCSGSPYQIQACDRITWDFGDGTTAAVTGQAQIAHTYTAAGTYTPSITIANSLGSLQPTLNTRVTVASNPPTFINFSPDQIIAPENVGSLTFTLARSGNLSVRSTVHWSHVETATGPVNQAEATGGDVTFAPGETTKTFSLRVYDDGVYNGYSARDWVVASATDGTMSGSSNFPSAAAFGQYLLTEVNAQPTASVADVRVLESAGTADFVITMSAPVAFAASFTATLADGTAKAGSDYTAASQQWCTITPGDTRCVIRIPIIDDSVPEPDKTFTLTIDSPNGAFGPAIVRSTATCTIVDDDAAPLAVTRIDPAYAPASGGSSVTLFGDGLDARCSVAFGSVPAAAIAPVSGGVSVVVPPHAPGAVDVTVVCGSARAVLPRAFTFFVPRRRAAG